MHDADNGGDTVDDIVTMSKLLHFHSGGVVALLLQTHHTHANEIKYGRQSSATNI